jgi:hypothetical protein
MGTLMLPMFLSSPTVIGSMAALVFLLALAQLVDSMFPLTFVFACTDNGIAHRFDFRSRLQFVSMLSLHGGQQVFEV